MAERLIQINQFTDEGRRHRITRLNDRLHNLNTQFGRGNGIGHENLINARRAFQNGAGIWADMQGRRHELSSGNLDYTETVFQELKPDLGRDHTRNR